MLNAEEKIKEKTPHTLSNHMISVGKPFEIKIKTFHKDTCALIIVLIKETWIVSFSSILKYNVIPGF